MRTSVILLIEDAVPFFSNRFLILCPKSLYMVGTFIGGGLRVVVGRGLKLNK